MPKFAMSISTVVDGARRKRGRLCLVADVEIVSAARLAGDAPGPDCPILAAIINDGGFVPQAEGRHWRDIDCAAANVVRLGRNEGTIMIANDFAGRRALVTGASSGIGRSTALLYAEAGAHVVAVARRQAELDKVKAEAESSGFTGTVEPAAGDITDADFVARLAESAGPVDALINCAGMLGHGPFLDTDPDEWPAVWALNVQGTMRLSQAIARGMRERGSGHIVIVTSILAGKVYRFTLPYAATKHALRAIRKGLRMELAEYGIKVTEVAPGLTDTPILGSFDNEDAAADYDARPYQPLDPDEVAAAIFRVTLSGPNTCPEIVEVHPLGQIE
jgi:NAD(P)-dependent dehydrogenase (short-subunit alcohol dehydrogenase family)